MKDPFFTFIIPVYNAEKYISRCIDSLLDQNFTEIEIILINDGSTDDSETIIKKYIEQYPEVIKYQYKNNEGIGPARNDGLKLATGKYIWFIDNDDCIRENCLSYLFNALSTKNIDILDIGFCHETYEKNPLKDIQIVNLNVEKITQKHAFVFCKDYPWSKIFRNQYLLEMKTSFPNVYGEDTATIYWLYANTNKIYKTDTILYAWNNRYDSFSNKVLTEKHFKTFPLMIETLIKQSEQVPSLQEEFNYIILSKSDMIISCFKNNQLAFSVLEDLKQNAIIQVENLLKNINSNIYIEIDKYINNRINDVNQKYQKNKLLKIYNYLYKIKSKIVNLIKK